MIPRGARLWWAATLLLAIAGCRNPFLPGQPAPPGVEGETVTVPMDFSSPELLFSTLTTALNVKNKGNGVTAYIAAFADSGTQGVALRVEFDPSVVAEREGRGIRVPAWQRSYEVDFYKHLSTLAEGDYSLALTRTLTDDTTEPLRQVFNREYSLTSTGIDGASTTLLASGWAEIEMRYVEEPAGQWVITRWTDHLLNPADPDPADPGQRCFSRLRFDSYNQ